MNGDVPSAAIHPGVGEKFLRELGVVAAPVRCRPFALAYVPDKITVRRQFHVAARGLDLADQPGVERGINVGDGKCHR